MPFGKHKGKPLSEIPRGYLQWLSRWEHTWPWLRKAAENELNGVPEPSEAQIIDDVIARTIRSLDEQVKGGT